MYEEYLPKALSNLIMARQAIAGYKLINQKDLKNGDSYHAQQSIELIIKYCIYNNATYNKNSNNNYNIRQIISHDIDKLISQYCIPLGIYVPKT